MKKIIDMNKYNEVMENLREESVFVRDYEAYLLDGQVIDEIIAEYDEAKYDEYAEYYLEYEIIQMYGDIFKLNEYIVKYTINLELEETEMEIIYANDYDISIDEMKKQKLLLGGD